MTGGPGWLRYASDNVVLLTKHWYKWTFQFNYPWIFIRDRHVIIRLRLSLFPVRGSCQTYDVFIALLRLIQIVCKNVHFFTFWITVSKIITCSDFWFTDVPYETHISRFLTEFLKVKGGCFWQCTIGLSVIKVLSYISILKSEQEWLTYELKKFNVTSCNGNGSNKRHPRRLTAQFIAFAVWHLVCIPP